jgi:hypothetical protein
MNDTDARILELEAQRDFMATRCVQFAAQVAALAALARAKDAEITELKAKPPQPTPTEPDPQP